MSPLDRRPRIDHRSACRRRSALCAVSLLLTLLLPIAPHVAAQNAEPDAPAVDVCAGKKLITRVMPVRFRPVSEAVDIAASLLGPCGEYRAPKSVRAVTVIDEPLYVSRVIEAIAGWDVPPPTVELTVSLIMARRDPPVAGTARPPIGDELRGVSEALAGLTQWAQYDLVSSGTVKVIEGGSAVVELADGFSVQLAVAGVDVNAGIIKLDPLVLARLPQQGEVAGASRREPQPMLSIRTNLREGHQEIIMAPNREKDRALIVALKAWTDIGGPPRPIEREPNRPARRP